MNIAYILVCAFSRDYLESSQRATYPVNISIRWRNHEPNFFLLSFQLQTARTDVRRMSTVRTPKSKLAYGCQQDFYPDTWKEWREITSKCAGMCQATTIWLYKTGYLSNIMFIPESCPRSAASDTPINYENGREDITCTFTKWKKKTYPYLSYKRADPGPLFTKRTGVLS